MHLRFERSPELDWVVDAYALKELRISSEWTMNGAAALGLNVAPHFGHSTLSNSTRSTRSGVIEIFC
jgi:hypothetical protein